MGAPPAKDLTSPPGVPATKSAAGRGRDRVARCLLLDQQTMKSDEQWLLLVDRKRPDLYEFLRREFAGRATVVLDRRMATGSYRPDRERRRGLEVLEAAVWHDEGYCVIACAGATASERQAARIAVRRAINRFSESRSPKP